jgi:soluble lytic murein transglycosylase-like protein
MNHPSLSRTISSAAQKLRLGARLFVTAVPFWLAIGHAASADLPPRLACAVAGHDAELRSALPANLLLSIGLVESGRTDPLSGERYPWPWTVNVDGTGYFFPSASAAAAFARLAAASGARDVDVGCFQVSLNYHGAAFASVDAAFDPATSAAFAARFLNALRMRSGSWEAAIADYHSGLPELGLPYERRVLAAWHDLGDMPADLNAQLLGSTGPFFTPPDATVILQAPAARLVRVFTPDGETGPPSRGWLPRVYTP